MNREQGFSLVELLIVVAIIAIIAAIAIPSMLTSRMAANESAAMQSCRTYGSAQIAYAASHNQDYAALATLTADGYLDTRFNAGGEIDGFDFAEDQDVAGITSDGTVANGSFGFVAAPTTVDVTGRYDFGIGPDQVVRYQTTAPAGRAAGDPVGGVAPAAGGGS